ncbi:MAG: glycosyltransferase family 4 protein [Elusimicrobiota bacterium]
MDRKFRIGMLISRFYPIQGGTELQCYRLSKELARKNNQIFVLTQLLPGLKAADEYGGLPIFRQGIPLKNRIGSLGYVLSGFFWLRKNLDNFDILHVHLASAPAVLAGIISRLYKKPVILKFGGSRKTGDIHTSLSTLHGNQKLGFIRNNMSHFVCPSKEIRGELLTAGFPDDKISIIPNGVDTSEFRPADRDEKSGLRQRLGLSLNERIVIYSGRFENGKGIEVLLETWERLRKEMRDIRLILIGTGSLEAPLKKQYGNVDSVSFLGWKENTADYLRAGDVFILPSFGEGLPNSLLEAMSCGLACVSTNIGGVSEIIRDGENGLLVEPKNSDALLNALRTLLSQKEKSAGLGGKARSFIEQGFSIEKVAEQYETIYRKFV